MENCGYSNYWPQDSSFMVSPWLSSGQAVAAPPAEWAEEDRAATASRSHSEAEKRRRDRINAQLSMMRKFIPMSEKMDKAALLGQVVHYVKEESKKAKEASKISTLIPTETDEVIIDHFTTNHDTSSNYNNVYMKASLCCEDRPELFSELNSALKGLDISIVEAEITSLGGRIRSNFVLCAKGSGNEQKNGLVRHSVQVALDRVVVSSGVTCYGPRSKRQRYFSNRVNLS